MKNIENIREKISDCDSKIIELLTERMNYIEDIIAYKKEHGLPILQEEFEAQKEISLRNQIDGNKFEDEILDVFRYIVDNGKKIQAKNLFAYNILLIGFMGVGKTTVSSYLSHMLSMEEIETDAHIVKMEGMTIAEMFKIKGEEYFRKCETNTLISLKQRQNTIISCGGGMALRDINVEYMKQSGKVVLLTASPETIFERVRYSNERPLLNGNMNIEFISNLMKQREQKYLNASDIIVSTDNKTINEICEEIVGKLIKCD